MISVNLSDAQKNILVANLGNKASKKLDSVGRKAKKISHKKALVLLSAFFVFLSVTIGSFSGYQYVYAQKIYPGVNVGNVGIGGYTKEEASYLVQSSLAQLNQSGVPIVISGQMKTVNLDQLGVHFDLDKLVNDAYLVGRDDRYLYKIPKALAALVKKTNIELEPQIDETKLNEAAVNLAPELIKQAKNATFKVEDDELISVLSETGTAINLDKLKNDLTVWFRDAGARAKIILATDLVEPDINAENLVKIKPLVERVIQEPIIIDSDYRRNAADKAEIASWIILKSDGSGSAKILFSDEEIKSYLDYISQKIEQKSLPRKIRADNGQVIDEGRDGLTIDRDRALGDIKAILTDRLNNNTASGSTVSLTVAVAPRQEKIVAPEDIDLDGGTPGLYEGKYLEVDLSAQVLYCWEGASQVCANQVSTGKWSTPTPVGTRYIDGKSDRAYSSKYNLYMPWWNSLGGGYGIHELPEWANGAKEGESHLGTPVSHGCIRLGVGPAEMVYSWAPEGTPVYIHK